MNADPKLVRSSIEINYSANDGYRVEALYRSGTGFRVGQEHLNPNPEEALLGALGELARITALFGFEDRALEIFNKNREAVFEWRRNRGT